MPRPCKRRRVSTHPKYKEFFTIGSINSQIVNLTIDEFECLRLLDYEKITQEECALKMMVARTTVTLIYQSARYKLMDALINGKKIIISGGNYILDKDLEKYNKLKKLKFKEKEKFINMRIAITYEHEYVFQHFGKSKQFKIYDVSEGQIVDTFILESNGAGHGALAGLLAENSVDVLICGGIGGGAINALDSMNIKVVAGANGNCDENISKFINNELDLNAGSNCHKHEHDDHHECHSGNHHHDEHHECHCGGHKEHTEEHECKCHK